MLYKCANRQTEQRPVLNDLPVQCAGPTNKQKRCVSLKGPWPSGKMLGMPDGLSVEPWKAVPSTTGLVPFNIK